MKQKSLYTSACILFIAISGFSQRLSNFREMSRALRTTNDAREVQFRSELSIVDDASLTCNFQDTRVEELTIFPNPSGRFMLTLPNQVDEFEIVETQRFPVVYSIVNNTNYTPFRVDNFPENLFSFRESLLLNPQEMSYFASPGETVGFFDQTTKEVFLVHFDSNFGGLNFRVETGFPLFTPCSEIENPNLVALTVADITNRFSNNIDSTMAIFSLIEGEPVDEKLEEVIVYNDNGDLSVSNESLFIKDDISDEFVLEEVLIDSSFYNDNNQIIRLDEYNIDLDLNEPVLTNQTIFEWEGENLTRRTLFFQDESGDELIEFISYDFTYSQDEIITVFTARGTVVRTVVYTKTGENTYDVAIEERSPEIVTFNGEYILEEDYFHNSQIIPGEVNVGVVQFLRYDSEGNVIDSSRFESENTRFVADDLFNRIMIASFTLTDYSFDPFNNRTILSNILTVEPTENTSDRIVVEEKAYNPFSEQLELNSVLTIDINLITGISPFNNENKQINSFYPNPCISTIQFDEPVEEVKLTTISGKEVGFWDKVENTLDLGEYEAGIYLIQYQKKGEIFSERLTVSR